MADQAQDPTQLIDSFGVSPDIKTAAWNAYHTAQDENALKTNIDQLQLPPEHKTALWNHWHVNHPKPGKSPTDFIADAGESAVGGAKGLSSYIAGRGPSGVLSDLGDTLKSGYYGATQALYDLGQHFWSEAQDPHTSLPAVGSIIGGIAGGRAGAPIQGAAEGGALGEGTAQVWDALHGRVSPTGAQDMGVAALTGAAGEVIPMIPRLRPEATEAGRLVSKVYDNPLARSVAMPHQLTDSPTLDFLYNIARGITGRSTIDTAAEAQGSAEKMAVDKIAGRMAQITHPGGLTSTTYGLPTDVQAQNIRQAAADAFDRAQKPLQKAYNRFFQANQGIYETTQDPITGATIKGKSLADLHAERSDALQAGRDALADNDSKAAYEANTRADSLLARMKKLMGPQASKAYDTLGDAYRQVMDRYDNALMNKFRRGVHPEQLADMILNPEQSFPKMTPLGQKVSQSVPEMINRMRKALPPEQWGNLQATVLQRLFENSIKVKGSNATIEELNAASMKRQLSKMGEGAFAALFGQSSAGTPAVNMKDINDFVTAVSQAGRAPGQTGKFFIDLRQAEAVRQVSAATVGGLAGGLVYDQSQGSPYERGAKGAAAAGATYLFAPWALAKLMTNPTTRNLFIRGLNETNPGIQAQIFSGLTRVLGQTEGAAASTELKSPATEGPGPEEPPASIPVPPYGPQERRFPPRGGTRGQQR